MFVVVARWYAHEGRDDEVAALLAEMTPHAMSEPGCALYIANRSTDDPRRFLLYEQYHDEAAFQAHTETAAFADLVVGRAVPLLEQREREIYRTLD